MAKLNENYINFCEQYVINKYNGSKAYQIAYNEKNKNTSAVAASKMLRDIRVIDKIKEIEGDYRVIGHRLGIDKKLILRKLLDLLSAKKQIFFNGQEVGEADDNASANKAIETLLKIMGDFAPEKKDLKITDDNDSEIDITKLNEKEREELKDKILRDL